MSVTRLKRKHRKNIARANNKQRVIKNMLRTPVLKNVDLEELKSRFTTAAPVAAAAPSVAEKVKHTAAAAVEAISHSEVVEKVKHVAADAVEAVAHSGVVEKIKEVAHDVAETAHDAVEAVKHAVASDDATAEEKAA